MDPHYTSLALADVCHDYAPMLDLLGALPYWSIDQRKTLLTLCRCQIIPHKDTVCYRRLRSHLTSTYYDSRRRKSAEILGIILPLGIFITSPVLSGLTSMAARSIHYTDYSSVLQTLEDGIQKELLASVEIFHPATFDWTPCWSNDKFEQSKPIHETYPQRPELCEQLSQGFHAARRILHGRHLFPDYSKKSVGSNARESMRTFLEKLGIDSEEGIWSTWGLERIYHEFGVLLAGFTEVRWAWKFNDLKPRIYFARGPDQYYPSRFLQEVFNIIIDQFSHTSRFERFFTSSLRGSAGDTCVIYDYSSFTSSLQEVVEFLRALATFFRGTSVNLVDSHEGVIESDLGDLLSSYVDQCNDSVLFDIQRLSDSGPEPLLLRHSCGMLGIPGNISSCTLLHGLHLAHVCGSINLCKVVGDDAVYWSRSTDRKMIGSVLQNLGHISIDKMHLFEEKDKDRIRELTWNYVKRPISRVDNRLIIGWQATWPSPEILTSSSPDNFHTTHPPTSGGDRVKKCQNMLLSFSLQFNDKQVEEEEVPYIDRFIRFHGRWIENRIRKYGLSKDRERIYPRRFELGVVESLVCDYWNSLVRLPVEDFYIRDAFSWERGYGVGRMSKPLKLLIDLGYCEADMKMEEVIVRDCQDKFERFLSKDIVPYYNITCLRKAPVWLRELYDSFSLRYTVPYDPGASDDIEE
jgi:hypothetical protein